MKRIIILFILRKKELISKEVIIDIENMPIHSAIPIHSIFDEI